MDQYILCNFNSPSFLIFSDKIPSLIYYSHLPILISSLIIGFYIFTKDSKKLSSKVIVFLTITFSTWVFLDSIFWASNMSNVIMFVWSIQILIEPLVHISAFYLLYLLIYERDLPYGYKLITILPYLPLIILAPTKYALTAFDIEHCLGQESIYSYYTYIMEIYYIVLIAFMGLNRYFIEKNSKIRKKILLLILSFLFLLVSFSWGSIVGSFTNDWNLAQFGLFGMPVFISFIIYNIINFNLFDIKLISKNIMVYSLWILIGSLLVITNINTSHVITLITLFISVILGVTIIKTTNKELEKAYSLEKKALRDLEKLTETKDNFISIAQHNLRIPITRLTNNIDSILKNKGDFVGSEEKNTLLESKHSLKNLNDIADDFKNISQMKLGSQILNIELTSLRPIIENIISELKLDIEKKNISIDFPADNLDWCDLRIDINKIRNVFLIILENAIKYNVQDGQIEIKTIRAKDTFTVTVKNTGIGITAEEKGNMYDKVFYRSKRARELNPSGMGIGLFLSKGVIEAHHGKIDIKSKGENMGVEVRVSFDIG